MEGGELQSSQRPPRSSVAAGLALYSNMSPPLPSRLHMRYMRNFYWKGYKDCLSQGQVGESPPGGSDLLLARNNNSYPHSCGRDSVR